MKEFEINQHIEIFNPENQLDFQTLKNPWGASLLCLQADYLFPNPSEALLIKHISEWLDIAPESIALGRNGSTEIINLIPNIFMEPNGTCIINTPTYFGLYDILVDSGRKIIDIPTDCENGLNYSRTHLEKMLFESQIAKPSLIWICSPNNPTGVVMPLEWIKQISENNPQSLIVVDEAYHEYIDPANTRSAVRLINKHANILVTKTFSKAFGLSDIKTGVAIGHPDTISAITHANQRPDIAPVMMSKAIASLYDLKHLFATQNKVKAELNRFYKQLESITTIQAGAKSETGVIILKHKYGNIWNRLNSRGIKSMDCNNLNGLQGQEYVRIGLQTPELNQLLIDTLKLI